MAPIPPPDAMRGPGPGADRWRAVPRAGFAAEPIDHTALRSALRKELSRAGRHGEPLSCLAIGLDGVDRPNERMGELRRNCVLAVTASALRDALRIYDTVARYGADEFLVLLPNTDLEMASALAERLRLTVRRTAMDLLPRTVEISVGVAEWHRTGMTGEELMDRADRALRAARSAGPKVSSTGAVPRPEGDPGPGERPFA